MNQESKITEKQELNHYEKNEKVQIDISIRCVIDPDKGLHCHIRSIDANRPLEIIEEL